MFWSRCYWRGMQIRCWIPMRHYWNEESHVFHLNPLMSTVANMNKSVSIYSPTWWTDKLSQQSRPTIWIEKVNKAFEQNSRSVSIQHNLFRFLTSHDFSYSLSAPDFKESKLLAALSQAINHTVTCTWCLGDIKRRLTSAWYRLATQ